MTNCRHPKSVRAPIWENPQTKRYHCTRCGEDIPRDSRPRRVKHGTHAGYDRHRSQRGGQWKWPACDPCRAAYREYQRQYHNGPQNQAKARERSVAKQRALTRLRRAHQAEYGKYYAEELGILRDGPASAVDVMQAEIDALLAEHKTGGYRKDPWADLNAAVKNNWATNAERGRWRRIVMLRSRIEQEQELAEEAQVAGGHRQ